MMNSFGHGGIYRAAGAAGNQARRRAGAASVVAGLLLAAGCARPGEAGAKASAGAMEVTRAVAWSAADVKAVTVGMEIRNRGDVDDTLVAVTSPAGAAMLHTEAPGQGMRPVATLPLPRRTAVRMGRGLHVMVDGLQVVPAAGTTVPVTLRFARAGPLDLAVPVLRYSEALTALGE